MKLFAGFENLTVVFFNCLFSFKHIQKYSFSQEDLKIMVFRTYKGAKERLMKKTAII